MILAMSKIRILGPQEKLSEVLAVLQDLGVLHLAPPPAREHVTRLELDARQKRQVRQLRGTLEDVESVLAAFGRRPAAPVVHPAAGDFARWMKRARRVRRAVDRLRRCLTELEEERALIEKYRQYLALFQALLQSQARWPNAVAYHLVLRTREAASLGRLRASLETAIGAAFDLRARALPTGELALLLIVTADSAPRVERVLSEARVQEIPVPASYGGGSLAEALPRMIERLEVLPREHDAARSDLANLAHTHAAELERARAAIRDRLDHLEATALVSVTDRAWLIEGWLPAESRGRLEERLRSEGGDTVVMQELSAEDWAAGEAPVVLSNPRLFRPFEAVIRLMPLPRYGSIDPTPLVGVFLPMFFGLILGDVGYGSILAILGLVLHARSEPGTAPRDVAEISGPCAAFSILFGFGYGELFGDLGRRRLGMPALLFDREEAVIPFLLLAVSIGVVHVLLGLGLGVVNTWRHHPRQAAGRGLAAAMIVLIIVALLAAFQVLPAAFFTPTVIALLVAFPLLVIVEGVIAAVEFLSMLGNILSYARIMALGTASVMLAVVANRMTGAIGSAVVGVVFALLFHLVNFALGLFSPTIHALRLHYVEFFGKFYSPGGARYRPFAHWKPGVNHAG